MFFHILQHDILIILCLDSKTCHQVFHCNHKAFPLIKQYKMDKCHMWPVGLHLDNPSSYYPYTAFTIRKHANSIQKDKAVTTCLSLTLINY